MCLACFPNDITRCPQAGDRRGVPPPPEKVAPMMSHICHLNRKQNLHRLVVPMTLKWKNVDMEFDPQVYQRPVKKWTDDSYQKARTVCAYEYEENSPTPQF
jgi:hypothetical protein